MAGTGLLNGRTAIPKAWTGITVHPPTVNRLTQTRRPTQPGGYGQGCPDGTGTKYLLNKRKYPLSSEVDSFFCYILSFNTHKVNLTTYTATSATIAPRIIISRLTSTSRRRYRLRLNMIPPIMEQKNQTVSLISLFFLFMCIIPLQV